MGNGISRAVVIPHKFADELKIQFGDVLKIHQDGATIVLEKLVIQ